MGAKFCSIACRNKSYIGRVKNFHKRVIRNGYFCIRVNNSYVFEHRYIMEKFLNRKLLLSEIVHHKNHDRQDNRIDNLEVMSRKQHNKLHEPEMVAGTRYRFNHGLRCHKPIVSGNIRPRGSPCNRPVPCHIH